ncbi:protein of unknown function [Caballeronia sp. S22]
MRPWPFACSLDFTACAQVCEHGVNTVLVDQAQAGVRDAQTDPAIFTFNEETAVLQVRQETTLGLVVCVGNVVARHRAFPSYLAYACHEDTPKYTLSLSGTLESKHSLPVRCLLSPNLPIGDLAARLCQ